MQKIGILTALTDFSSAYSLTSVIRGQARMLEKDGREFDVLCCKSFNADDQDLEWVEENSYYRFCIDSTPLHDYKPNEGPKEDFQLSVEMYEKTYRECLADYDIIITHDLMFLSWFLPQNQAIRNLIEEWPDKRWLHWVHSGPSAPPPGMVYPTTLRYMAAPNSKYVFLNHNQKQDLANSMGLDAADVAVVYNSRDIRDVYEFDSESSDLIEKYRLLDHDILQTYPFSTPRWKEKGVRQLMKIWSYWKNTGIKAKLVLVNSHANGEEGEKHIQEMKDYAFSLRLTVGKDVIFTSDEAQCGELTQDWCYSVPGDIVRNLTIISNMFIFPSISECCSLIQAEAAIAGKFMVLNTDFLPMFEFVSANIPHYRFTLNDPEVNPAYYECVAREILKNFKNESSVMNSTLAKTRFYNSDHIWETQFAPILDEQCKESPVS